MSASDKHPKPYKQYTNEEPVKAEELSSYIAFELAEENFAIRIEDVREVTHTPTISQMPKTPDFFEGVANIRGDIVTILNLEKKLKLNEKINLQPSKKRAKYTLVLDMKDYQIGFTVNKVPQTLILEQGQIQSAEEITKATRINYYFLDGLGRKDGVLYMLLNIKKVFSTTDYKKITKLTNEAQNEEKTNISSR